MDGTHGFGFGVTGAELRARIAAQAACPECVGTGRRWSLDARANVRCEACAASSARDSSHPGAATMSAVEPRRAA